MGSWMGLIGSIIVVIAALAQCTAAQTTYIVGDSAGWTVQSYDSWLSGKKFVLGDKLSFTFNAQAHDVAQVSKAGYDSCTNASMSFLSTTSPTLITLNTTGERYYICTIPGHCNGGQKLSINVSSTTGSPEASPTPTAGSPSAGSAPPSPSSAPSRAAAFGVAGAFMAVLTALFL